jgi:uncharacterized protein (DUF486 family)
MRVASRCGAAEERRTLSLAQLKILQEAITLSVFVPFAVLYMRRPVRLNSLWAGLCLMGAVWFVIHT